MNSVGNQLEEVTTQLKYEPHCLDVKPHETHSYLKLLMSFCRYYEDIPSYIKTVNEMEAYEEFLKQTMTQIQIHKATDTK